MPSGVFAPHMEAEQAAGAGRVADHRGAIPTVPVTARRPGRKPHGDQPERTGDRGRRAADRRRPRVFSVISAIDQWPSWNPDIKSVSAEGPVQPGTCSGGRPGPALTSTLQVVDPPREIAWTGTTMGIKAVHVFRFQASDGGDAARSRGVLGGVAGQPPQGLQPQDPGQGHPQRARAPQDRGRAPGRDGVSQLRDVSRWAARTG